MAYIGSAARQVAMREASRGRNRLSKLPPPVTESRFRDLEGANKEQVKARAAPLVESLHSYLNFSSCLKGIQRIRRDWNPRTKSRLAFEGDEFLTDREHWYTYNTGGRSEVQFNVGLFPDHLRVGLGFELTRRAFGEPEKVLTAYDAFRSLVERDQPILDRFAQKNGLWIEWLPKGKSGRDGLEYVESKDLTAWLVSRKKEADWIFVGRLLILQ